VLTFPAPVPAQADKVNATRPTTRKRIVFFIPLPPFIESGGIIPHLEHKKIHILCQKIKSFHFREDIQSPSAAVTINCRILNILPVEISTAFLSSQTIRLAVKLSGCRLAGSTGGI
jgi:hypothetical protein